MGPCNKIHDEGLKKQYEKSSRFGRLGYDDDYERFLRSLLNDVERKIRRNSERLKLTQTESTDGTVSFFYLVLIYFFFDEYII